MNFRAVIFDLDGTLLNTLADIAAAANRTMAFYGYPTHPVEAYRYFVGDGSAMLIKRSMPVDERTPEKISACLKYHLEDYNQNWAAETQPYDGIPELLTYLKTKRIHLAVVTNKPKDSALMTLEHFFDGIEFDFFSGLGPGIKKKPDPEQTLAAAEAMGVLPGQCLFLGDTSIDMQVATKAGMKPVGAAWGFRTKDELRRAGAWRIIDHPMELTTMI
jgi:phosphoglycolate phosphatase